MEMRGKYELVDRLAEGPFGPYYCARDTSSQQIVTLITLGADIPWDPLLKERFTAECAALRNLRHPNVVAVYEYREDQSSTYLITDKLPQKDLRSLISEHSARTLEWKLAFMVQVAAGLDAAHSAGVCHRCLRPDFIHLRVDGTAKISGFLYGNLPVPGKSVNGSPTAADVYLSPEQLQGKEATFQSDIYSVGLIFYELVTGVHPFHDEDNNKTVHQILHQPQVPTVEEFPNLPFNLWPVLERCLAREPEERFANAREFGTACQAMLEELAEDSECMRIELQTALPRLRKIARRQDATPALKTILSEVEKALFRAQDSDYQSLNRLILTLMQQYRLFGAPAEELREANIPDEPSDRLPLELCADPRASGQPAAPVPDTDNPPGTRPENAAAHIDSGSGQHAAHPESPEPSVAPLLSTPQVLPVESPGLPAQENAANTAHASVKAVGDAARTRPTPKDSFTELLRKIDQGQESTQKLVDDFLAGRRSRILPAERGPNGDAIEKPAAVRTEGPTSAVHPAEPDLKSAQQLETESLNQEHSSEVNAPPVEDHLEAAGKMVAQRKPARRLTVFWIAAATLLLMTAVAIPGVGNRLIAGISEVLAKGGIGINKGQETQIPPQPEDPMAVAVRNRLNFARRDVLLEEAEILHAVGRRDEARVFLNRLLELYPDYAPALRELDEIKTEADTNQEQNPQQPIERLLGNASSAIKSGNLQKAKTDLDAAESLQPGLPEVAKLRKSLEAKKAELAQNASREPEAQLSERKQGEAEARAVRVEDYYRQGRYDETLALLDGSAVLPALSPQMLEIRNRSLEMRQGLKTYETALNAGRLSEAQAALERIERINPADPNLPALRKRMEQLHAPGRAILNIFPLAEPAALLLDDRPVGAAGEVSNHAVEAGRHKLVARGSSGREADMIFEAAGGQITLVYDVAGPVLRAISESDRARVSRSRARAQVHRFAVEHSHGLLRGSCKGEMAVNYYHIVFMPVTGPHGFRVPFKEFKLRIDNKSAVLLFAANGTEFLTFKLPDASTAQQMLKLWEDLTALDK